MKLLIKRKIDYWNILITITTALLFCSITNKVAACSVPVFRYALEHWAPDNYTITVIASRKLDSNEQKALNWLKAIIEKEGPNLNLTINTAKTIENGKTNSPAIMRIFYPGKTKKITPFELPLTLPNVKKLVQSPIRKEIQKMLKKAIQQYGYF